MLQVRELSMTGVPGSLRARFLLAQKVKLESDETVTGRLRDHEKKNAAEREPAEVFVKATRLMRSAL